ncbi:MAG TPA: RNA 2',3'-cyclic phosphodiesterase [Candidatus Binatia bacterium]|nr:RNA 2',3'-cyclic phosphodiesterase [Candidatus Binatia bacterium]
MIRAFLAIRPTDDVIGRLTEVQSELSESGADVRWVSAETLHLTIQFLGEVRESEVPEIERGLQQGLSTLAPFEIECRGLGIFPNQKRPRVVWVGLHGAGIAALAERVEIVLSPLGFPPEERELTPHITLGRLRSARGWEALARLLKANGDRSFGMSRIDHITLYRSQLRPEGAVYTPLVKFSLAGD